MRRRFSLPVLASIVAGLIGGAMLGSLQIGCGVVEKTACAAEECQAGAQGPQGEPGPPGPAGPAGPGFGSCQWLYNSCNSAPGVACEQVCPAGTHPVSGSCDLTAGGALTEHRASVAGEATFPASPAPFTAYDRWLCRSSSGNVQATYALCCAP